MKAALTPREQQLIVQLSHNRTLAQMAADLGLSPNTVDVYLSRISEKFGVRRRDLRLWAIEERVRQESMP